MKISGLLALLNGTLAAAAATSVNAVVDIGKDTQSSAPSSAAPAALKSASTSSSSSSSSAQPRFQPSDAFTSDKRAKMHHAVLAAELMTRLAARVARSNRTRVQEFFGPVPQHNMRAMQKIIAGRFDLIADECRSILSDSNDSNRRHVTIAYDPEGCNAAAAEDNFGYDDLGYDEYFDEDGGFDDGFDDGFAPRGGGGGARHDKIDDAADIGTFTVHTEPVSRRGGRSGHGKGSALIVVCPAAMDRLPVVPARTDAPSLAGRLIHELTHALFRTKDHYLTPGVPPPQDDEAEQFDSNRDRKSKSKNRHHPKDKNHRHSYVSSLDNADTYHWFAIDALLEQVPSLEQPQRNYYHVDQDKNLARPAEAEAGAESNDILP